MIGRPAGAVNGIPPGLLLTCATAKRTRSVSGAKENYCLHETIRTKNEIHFSKFTRCHRAAFRNPI